MADELHSATIELVTNDDLNKALAALADKLTLRICSIIGAMLAVMVALDRLIT